MRKLIVLLIAMLFLTGCVKQTDEEIIQGKWELISIKNEADKDFVSISEDVDLIMTFNEDNSVTVSGKDNDIIRDNYKNVSWKLYEKTSEAKETDTWLTVQFDKYSVPAIVTQDQGVSAMVIQYGKIILGFKKVL